MAQHFLLSAAARTLSLRKIYSEGEQAAYETFCKMRWPETDGEPEGVPGEMAPLLEEVYQKYGRLSPFRLSEITHEPGGPWESARKVGGWYAEIPDSLIKPHYQLKRLKAKASHE